MKKVLIVTNHYPISPRLNKLVNNINEEIDNVEVKILAWNRGNIKKKTVDNIILYNSDIGYGNKIKKIIGIKEFSKFLKQITQKYNPDIIHAIDIDMLLATYISKNRDSKIIYEIYDIITFNKKYIDYLIRILEYILIKKVDKIIYASPFFKNKYKYFKGKSFVLDNKPNNNIIKGFNSNNNHNKEYITISFIGVVRYIDILKNLIDSIKDRKNIKLLIAGRGPDLEALQKYSSNINNVNFYGEYEYEDISKIYSKTDIIWAAYPYKDDNVKLAISNKFFESIAFNIPAIYSINTYLGEYVKKNNLGIVTNPYSIEDINKTIDEIILNKCNIEKIKIDMKKEYKNVFWESQKYIIKDIYNN